MIYLVYSISILLSPAPSISKNIDIWSPLSSLNQLHETRQSAIIYTGYIYVWNHAMSPFAISRSITIIKLWEQWEVILKSERAQCISPLFVIPLSENLKSMYSQQNQSLNNLPTPHGQLRVRHLEPESSCLILFILQLLHSLIKHSNCSAKRRWRNWCFSPRISVMLDL